MSELNGTSPASEPTPRPGEPGYRVRFTYLDDDDYDEMILIDPEVWPYTRDLEEYEDRGEELPDYVLFQRTKCVIPSEGTSSPVLPTGEIDLLSRGAFALIPKRDLPDHWWET